MHFCVKDTRKINQKILWGSVGDLPVSKNIPVRGQRSGGDPNGLYNMIRVDPAEIFPVAIICVGIMHINYRIFYYI